MGGAVSGSGLSATGRRVLGNRLPGGSHRVRLAHGGAVGHPGRRLAGCRQSRPSEKTAGGGASSSVVLGTRRVLPEGANGEPGSQADIPGAIYLEDQRDMANIREADIAFVGSIKIRKREYYYRKSVRCLLWKPTMPETRKRGDEGTGTSLRCATTISPAQGKPFGGPPGGDAVRLSVSAACALWPTLTGRRGQAIIMPESTKGGSR